MMPRGLTWLALAICLVLHVTACAASTENVSEFISILEDRGFTVQEGRLGKLNMLELCSAGYVNYCFGNNAGFPYAIYILPPSPGQDPSARQAPPVGYGPVRSSFLSATHLRQPATSASAATLGSSRTNRGKTTPARPLSAMTTSGGITGYTAA